MLLFSPAYLFLIPGLFFFLAGLVLVTALAPGPLTIGAIYMGPHWMVLGSLSTLLGSQVLSNYSYVLIRSIGERSARKGLCRIILWIFCRERGFLFGSVIALFGLAINGYVAWRWIAAGFGPLYHIHTAIFGSTLTLLGVQVVFSSFFVDFLNDNGNDLDRL
jgi:hypothetical protein